MRKPTLLVALLFPSLLHAVEPSRAQPSKAQPSSAAPAKAIAVMEISAPDADKDRAKGLAGVVAARLASYKGARVVGLDEIFAALQLEKQKLRLGCNEESCLQEIAGALGVRYLVHGRLDRFGKSTLLNLFIFDSQSARGVLRWSQPVEDDARLVSETERFAVQAAAELGLSQQRELAAVESQASYDSDFHLNLKLGNTLGSLKGASLSAFNARFDLEGDYYFTPHWQAFLELGFVIGTASDATSTSAETRSFRLFPAFAGAKYTFRPETDVRPYVGLGLGLALINKLFRSSNGDTSSISTEGVVGLAWMPFRRVGFNFEAGVNLAGVTSESGGVLFAFNTNFGVITLF